MASWRTISCRSLKPLTCRTSPPISRANIIARGRLDGGPRTATSRHPSCGHWRASSAASLSNPELVLTSSPETSIAQTAREKTSALWANGLLPEGQPWAWTSGAVNTAATRKPWCAQWILRKPPMSVSLTCPSCSTKLLVLMSRWATPEEWRWANPLQASPMYRRTSASGRAPPAASFARRREPPLQSSRSKCVGASVSKTFPRMMPLYPTMFGCCTWENLRTSSMRLADNPALPRMLLTILPSAKP
mmetsp:Transcript_4154/g.15527  ORF Transcript_4154/g.15527 Transcript_4154/m.15527 type:complete len:247 (+) Transcript_4154:1560-2300(+)